MPNRIRSFAALSGLLFLASCSSSENTLPLAGSVNRNDTEAANLFQQAQGAESSGDGGKAIKLYDKVADNHPWYEKAAEARYKQAVLLDQQGKVEKAFEAYQLCITRYRGSGLYEPALRRQAQMAKAAADGEIKTSFLGLKSNLDTAKIVEMLGKVRDNAPLSPTASLAQFTIGETYQSKGKATEAIDAYKKLVRDFPDSREAAEGQYRIGVILTESARRGNQDQANIDAAREAYEDYLNRYPTHSKVGKAREEIKNLGGQDVERSLKIAEFYEKSGNVSSARFYYKEVLKKSAYGPTHDKAKARLAVIGN